MRFNPYDDVYHENAAATSVAIQSLTGSTEVDSDGLDTALAGLESLMVHVRAEIASGSPTAATVAWALLESDDNSTFVAAKDNTGTAIGGTLNVHTAAQDAYARVEGINLQSVGSNTEPTASAGGRKRYLAIGLTPAFTSGTTPAILAYAEFIGATGNGAQLPVRSTTSNT
jgi:hypothetical protein